MYQPGASCLQLCNIVLTIDRAACAATACEDTSNLSSCIDAPESGHLCSGLLVSGFRHTLQREPLLQCKLWMTEAARQALQSACTALDRLALTLPIPAMGKRHRSSSLGSTHMLPQQ